MKKIIRQRSKGFCITEVMCSIAIFSIIVIIVFNTHIVLRKNMCKDKKLREYSCISSGVKYSILKNCSYESIKEIKAKGNIYLEDENLNPDRIIEKNILDLLKTSPPKEKPFVELKIKEDENAYNDTVIVIKIILHYSIEDRQYDISSEFLKGKY
ncbi:hypothetical protein ACER0A_007525 [Haloimpatiens sp. FM7315]|uniref:hypothetical protein n=1 Tax=Haloimpatiens sp. FM7315 TaxID=3298609 RepID=UPI0035A2F8EE